MCIHKKICSLLHVFYFSIVVHIQGFIFSCFYYHKCFNFRRNVTNKINFIHNCNWIHFILINFFGLHLISTYKHYKYWLHYIVWLNKHYFIVRGLGVIFSNYPTLILVLVVVQSFVNSHVLGGFCFCCVEGPRFTSLKLHIVFFWVLQFLLFI